MITADPNRTPNFILFGNPDYFQSASGKTTPPCTPMFDAASCFVEEAGYQNACLASSRSRFDDSDRRIEDQASGAAGS